MARSSRAEAESDVVPASAEPIESPIVEPAAAEPREALERSILAMRARRSRHSSAYPRSPVHASGPTTVASVALLMLGALMLVVAGRERLLPRARYVRALPTPGTSVPEAPEAVTVEFDQQIRASSSLSVARTATDPALEEDADAGPTTMQGGVDTRSGRRLVAHLPSGAPTGVYRVDWRAVPSSGGITRSGTFYFGVGMDLPGAISGESAVRERDIQDQDRRATLAGGVLLILIGVGLPFWRRGIGTSIARGA